MKYSDPSHTGRGDHVLVTSAKQLVNVLREGLFRSRVFGLALAGKLLLSSRNTAPALIGTGGVLQLCEITLPDIASARDWWRAFWDDECVDFYVTTDHLPRMAAVAKAAVWRALPEIRMDLPKRCFRIVSEESFRMLVGDENMKGLMNECSIMGVGMRFLTGPLRVTEKMLKREPRAGRSNVK